MKTYILTLLIKFTATVIAAVAMFATMPASAAEQKAQKAGGAIAKVDTEEKTNAERSTYVPSTSRKKSAMNSLDYFDEDMVLPKFERN